MHTMQANSFLQFTETRQKNFCAALLCSGGFTEMNSAAVVSIHNKRHPERTHLHLGEDLSFLALLQAGPECSHHVLLRSNHLHNFLVTLNTHSLGREEKMAECWLCVSSLTFAYANLPLSVGITSKQSQPFPQKQCHLASAATAQATRKPETEIVIRKRKANILRHLSACGQTSPF